MTATCVMDRKVELYEHLRTYGQIPDNECATLRREVYLMAWRAMPSAVKEELSRARTVFKADFHENLERRALMSLPPYQQLI